MDAQVIRLAVPGEPVACVEAVVKAYARVEPRRVGRCVASRAGDTREAVELGDLVAGQLGTVVTTIRRAARFVAHVVDSAEQAVLAALWLKDEIAGLPVDELHWFEAVKTWPRRHRDCVAACPRDDDCPFCRVDALTWEDGGTGLSRSR